MQWLLIASESHGDTIYTNYIFTSRWSCHLLDQFTLNASRYQCQGTSTFSRLIPLQMASHSLATSIGWASKSLVISIDLTRPHCGRARTYHEEKTLTSARNGNILTISSGRRKPSNFLSPLFRWIVFSGALAWLRWPWDLPQRSCHMFVDLHCPRCLLSSLFNTAEAGAGPTTPNFLGTLVYGKEVGALGVQGNYLLEVSHGIRDEMQRIPDWLLGNSQEVLQKLGLDWFGMSKGLCAISQSKR